MQQQNVRRAPSWGADQEQGQGHQQQNNLHLQHGQLLHRHAPVQQDVGRSLRAGQHPDVVAGAPGAAGMPVSNLRQHSSADWSMQPAAQTATHSQQVAAPAPTAAVNPPGTGSTSMHKFNVLLMAAQEAKKRDAAAARAAKQAAAVRRTATTQGLTSADLAAIAASLSMPPGTLASGGHHLQHMQSSTSAVTAASGPSAAGAGTSTRAGNGISHGDFLQQLQEHQQGQQLHTSQLPSEDASMEFDQQQKRAAQAPADTDDAGRPFKAAKLSMPLWPPQQQQQQQQQQSVQHGRHTMQQQQHQQQSVQHGRHTMQQQHEHRQQQSPIAQQQQQQLVQQVHQQSSAVDAGAGPMDPAAALAAAAAAAAAAPAAGRRPPGKAASRRSTGLGSVAIADLITGLSEGGANLEEVVRRCSTGDLFGR